MRKILLLTFLIVFGYFYIKPKPSNNIPSRRIASITEEVPVHSKIEPTESFTDTAPDEIVFIKVQESEPIVEPFYTESAADALIKEAEISLTARKLFYCLPKNKKSCLAVCDISTMTEDSCIKDTEGLIYEDGYCVTNSSNCVAESSVDLYERDLMIYMPPKRLEKYLDEIKFLERIISYKESIKQCILNLKVSEDVIKNCY